MANRTKGKNLPERVYRKTGALKDGGTWETFYHICSDPITGKRTETALGGDYEQAVRKAVEIDAENATKVALMSHAFNKYAAEILPTLSERSQQDAKLIMRRLHPVFANAPMDAVTPQIVAKYRDKRSKTAPIRANREMAYLSTVWNYAREWGFTEKENPCRGVKKNKEKPRDFYADDETFSAVYQHANAELKNAMDLAYLTGQRPADVLAFEFSQIVDGHLQLEQAKTGKKLNIMLNGPDGPNELGKVIGRIIEENRISEFLVCNRDGDALNTQTLRVRFNKAKAKALVDADDELAEKIKQFQFRDIRPKAASEMPLDLASALLGHTKEEITKKVYQRKGATVAPTR